MPESPRFREYRAPRSNKQKLFDPPTDSYDLLAEENRLRLVSLQLASGGRKPPDSSSKTLSEPVPPAARTISGTRLQNLRIELIQLASDYLRELGLEPPPVSANSLLYLTGHQPGFAHPGVLLKNFVLHQASGGHEPPVSSNAAARNSGATGSASVSWFAESGGSRPPPATGLNLIVDQDLVEERFILVPSGTRDEPVIERIPFDLSAPPRLWEQAKILDPQHFDRFSHRISETLRPWGFSPILEQVWEQVRTNLLRRGTEQAKLVDLLTLVRVLTERRLGIANLELPVSRLARLTEYRSFVASLLLDLDRFQQCYNRALFEYRRFHGIQHPNHPMPDLQEAEAPFWAVLPEQGLKERLFARCTGDVIQLFRGNQLLATVPAREDALVEAIGALEGEGLGIRPRAITNTLFARLYLGEFFIHGIGGALYDQITDQIIEDYYEITPPAFATVTGTLWLPLNPHGVSLEDVHKSERAVRDGEWSPERTLPETCAPVTQQLAAVIEELRREFVATPKGQRASLHRQLRDARRNLLSLIASEHAQRVDLRDRTRREYQADRILTNREYATILFPESDLQSFFQN